MIVLLVIAAIVGLVTGLAKRKSDQIAADVLSRSTVALLRQTPMRTMDVAAAAIVDDWKLLDEYTEYKEPVRGRHTRRINMKPIGYRDGGTIQRNVSEWVDGDVNFPHVVTRAPMLVYTAGDGMRRICPTRDPLRWVSIGAPYLKPATTWNKVSLGTPVRSKNALTWTTAQAKVNVVMGGHLIDLSCEFLGGWLPPNNQIAFPVGMSGLTRKGSVFYADGKPVLTLRPFQMYDAANPMDTRVVDTKLVQVGTQWYALATIPSVVGMSRPVLDPTLTLQPDAAAGKDTIIYPSLPTRNYGARITLDVGADTKILISFDLSSIPPAAICNSVVLSLWNTLVVPSNRQATIYQLAEANANYPEGTQNNAAGGAGDCCWNFKEQTPGAETAWAGSAGCSTAGVDYINTLLGTVSYIVNSPAGTEIATTLNAAGIAAAQANFGGVLPFLLINTNRIDLAALATSDNGTSAYRPKLVIEYTEAATPSGKRWFPLIIAAGKR